MKFGLGLPTEGLIHPPSFFPPEELISVAQLAERLGYDSIWGTDHYATVGYVRELYREPPSFYELLTVLSAISSVTRSLELGTAVLVTPMRDVVTVAKQVMTLDQLSRGRVLLGVGVGAYREEFAAARPDLVGRNRGTMLEEGLQLFAELTTKSSVTFDGRFYKAQELELYPKPCREPLPVLIAGHPERAIDRAVAWGHGWIPPWQPFEQLSEWVRLLRDKASEAGRDPESFIVAPQQPCLIAETQAEAERRFFDSGMAKHRQSLAKTGRQLTDAIEHILVGDAHAVREKVERFAAAGANHLACITFCVNSREEYIEQLHAFAEEIMVPYRRDHDLRPPNEPVIDALRPGKMEVR